MLRRQHGDEGSSLRDLTNMNNDKQIHRYLMSGADALKAENIIKLFEQLKGRPATNQEKTNVERIFREAAEAKK
jgi:hypothetical protein